MEERNELFTLAEKQKLDSAFKKVNFNDPMQSHALAEIVSRLLYEDVRHQDILSLMCDIEYFELGQQMQFAVTKGVKAFVHEPGSYAPRSVVVKKTLDLYAEQTSVNLQLNLLELKSGRYGSLPDLKRQMAREILGARYAAIWNAFKAAVPSGTVGNYHTIAAASGADDKMALLNRAITNMNDRGAIPKAIVGRYKAVSWISDISSTYYSDEWRGIRDRVGFLGAYRGIPIVYLTQYEDGYGQLRIDGDNLFIVAEGCGKFGIQLDNFVTDAVNADTLDWNLHFTEIWGAGVTYAERLQRLYFS